MKSFEFNLVESITINSVKIEKYQQDGAHKYWYSLTGVMRSLGYSGLGLSSYAETVKQDLNYAKEFLLIGRKAFVSQKGILGILKMSRKAIASELYHQLCNLGFEAASVGLINEGPLHLFPSSPYLHFRQELGPCCSSKVIAQVFGKTHKAVLQSIENVLQLLDQELTSQKKDLSEYSLQASSLQYKFECNTTQDLIGYTKEYFLSENLFNLVALSFTGEKAFKYKMLFVSEFANLKTAYQANAIQQNSQKAFTESNGFLYIMKNCHSISEYKIGITMQNPSLRAKQLNKTADADVRLLWHSPACLNYKDLEKQLHKLFANKAIVPQGIMNPSKEWFNLNEYDFARLDAILTVWYGSVLSEAVKLLA